MKILTPRTRRGGVRGGGGGGGGQSVAFPCGSPWCAWEPEDGAGKFH